jgi:NAD(P)H-hydrate epimerase
MRMRWPGATRCLVVCGGGNNGGDGYVIARLAAEAGLDVGVVAVSDPARLQGAAREAFEDWRRMAGRTRDYRGEGLDEADVIVDALLGTGLDRIVEGRYAEVIEAINGHRAPVLAVDIPSGINADSGRVMGVGVKAGLTVSFIGRKRGLYTADGPDHAGYRLFEALEVPPVVYDAVAPDVSLMTAGGLRWPTRRALNAHKGHFGRLLVVGGGQGMAGAARMAGVTALRSGAGLVTVACHPDSAAAISGGRPELMTAAVTEPADLQALVRGADVIAAGPGLGRSAWARALLTRILEARCPLVLDADALNLLAEDPLAREDWVLTPHPGEAARLLGTSVPAVQNDRFGAARSLHERYAGTLVLKGRGSLVVGADGRAQLCDHGHPAMATAGMGDVLTGVVAGLRVQGMSGPEAAALGVWVHALAGERCARKGPGILAGEVGDEIRVLLDGGGTA